VLLFNFTQKKMQSAVLWALHFQFWNSIIVEYCKVLKIS